jgi:hypothetical protein
MEKYKKRRINISKVAHANGIHLFWYDINGANRKIIRGTLKEVHVKRDALIEEFKNDILIVRT